jgi:hypothetical protein
MLEHVRPAWSDRRPADDYGAARDNKGSGQDAVTVPATHTRQHEAIGRPMTRRIASCTARNAGARLSQGRTKFAVGEPHHIDRGAVAGC